jgi:hypothetical protein
MERRSSPRRDWVVAEDDVGRPVLEWRVDPRATSRAQSDPNARTYDFLKRLEVPDLEIEDDARSTGATRARTPYDNAAGAHFRKQRR